MNIEFIFYDDIIEEEIISSETPLEEILLLKGEPGDPGKDGVSPELTETKTKDGYDIEITDVTGTRTISLKDGDQGPEGPQGQPGANGKDGKDGEDGYTPVKGVDYFTEQDKQELLSGVEEDIAELDRDKADKTEIPDVSSFITKDVNNLTHYTLKTATGSLIDLEINQSTYVVSLSLKDIDGNVISTDTIDLPLESVVIGGRFDSVNKKIVLTLENGNTVDIPVGDLVAGLQTEITSSNKLASDLVDDTNSGNKFTNTSEKTAWNAKYDKPSGGIPKADLASDVQTSLEKANTALQEHQSLTDYVKNTDYATSSKGGVIKVSGDFATTKNTNGYLQAATKTHEQYESMSNNAFIGKGTLENVITGKQLINKTTLDESQAEQDAKIEKINENNFDFDTATGETLTLSNTAKYPFKEFNVGGNTKQQTYTGKNILDATAESYTLPANSTKYQTIHNTKPYLEAGTKYYISYNIDNASTSNTRSTPRLYYNNTQYVQAAVANYNLTAGRKVWEFTPTESGDYDVQYWLQGSDVAVTVSDFMISTSSDTTYEPYVGGQASPNPSYPQPAENVSGEVEVKVENKNLLNTDSLEESTKAGITITPVRENGLLKYINVNGTYNGTGSSVNWILGSYTVSQGTTYYLSGIKGYSSSTFQMFAESSTAFPSGNRLSCFDGEKSATAQANETINIRLYAYSGTSFNNVKIYPMLATTSGAYEPHEEQIATLTLPTGMEMCKIGDYKDSFVYQGGKWYKSALVRKLELAIANMNNSEDYPGWQNQSQMARDYPNTNKTLNLVTSYMHNIGTTGVAINTGTGGGIIYLSKGTFGLNQSQWIEQYPNLVFKLYYGLQTPDLQEITDTTLISQLDNLANLYSYKGTTYISSNSDPSLIFEVKYAKDSYLPNALTSLTDKTNENSNNINDIQEEQIEQNGNIQSNSEDIDKLQNKVDLLENIFPPINKSGENITITDSIRYPFKEFNVGGNTKQNTTTGKNLLPYENTTKTLAGVTITHNEDGSITLNGTSTDSITYRLYEDVRTLLDTSKRYTLSTQTNMPEKSFIRVQKSGDSSTFVDLSSQATIKNYISFYGSALTSDIACFLYLYKGYTFNNVTIYPMLEEGSTMAEFEKYTNGASPNPSYPQEIYNVSGEVEVKVANGTDSTATGYEEQTATLHLPEGMEVRAGDRFVYQNNIWNIDRAKGAKILDGTQTVGTDGSTTNYRRFTIAKSLFEGIGSSAISSHLQYLNSYSSDTPHFYIGTNVVYFFILEPTATATDFRTWLGTNNITIEYELATPVLEEITDTTLIEQLDNLANLYSYKGTTYISSSNEPSPVFEVVYRTYP